MVEHCSSHHRACISRGHMMKRRPWDDTTCTTRGLWTTNHKDMTRTRTLVRNLTPQQINTKKKQQQARASGWLTIFHCWVNHQRVRFDTKWTDLPVIPIRPWHLICRYIWETCWNTFDVTYIETIRTVWHVIWHSIWHLVWYFFAAANLTFCLTYIPLYSGILI